MSITSNSAQLTRLNMKTYIGPLFVIGLNYKDEEVPAPGPGHYTQSPSASLATRHFLSHMTIIFPAESLVTMVTSKLMSIVRESYCTYVTDWQGHPPVGHHPSIIQP